MVSTTSSCRVVVGGRVVVVVVEVLVVVVGAAVGVAVVVVAVTGGSVSRTGAVGYGSPSAEAHAPSPNTAISNHRCIRIDPMKPPPRSYPKYLRRQDVRIADRVTACLVTRSSR